MQQSQNQTGGCQERFIGFHIHYIWVSKFSFLGLAYRTRCIPRQWCQYNSYQKLLLKYIQDLNYRLDVSWAINRVHFFPHNHVNFTCYIHTAWVWNSLDTAIVAWISRPFIWLNTRIMLQPVYIRWTEPEGKSKNRWQNTITALRSHRWTHKMKVQVTFSVWKVT